MIVYQPTRAAFLQDLEQQEIEDIISTAFLQKTGRYAPESEFRAGRHSLTQMADVLSDDSLAADMGVGIEFGIPQTAKHIDY